jgi:hypothetical protein
MGKYCSSISYIRVKNSSISHRRTGLLLGFFKRHGIDRIGYQYDVLLYKSLFRHRQLVISRFCNFIDISWSYKTYHKQVFFYIRNWQATIRDLLVVLRMEKNL